MTDLYMNRTKCEDVDRINEIGFEHILEKLQTSLEGGIKSSTVDERIKAYGTNKSPQTPINGCIRLFIHALNDFTLIILILAALVSIVVNFLTEEHLYLGISLILTLSLDRRIRNFGGRFYLSRSPSCIGLAKGKAVRGP